MIYRFSSCLQWKNLKLTAMQLYHTALGIGCNDFLVYKVWKKSKMLITSFQSTKRNILRSLSFSKQLSKSQNIQFTKIKQRKAANPHTFEAGTRQWLVTKANFVMNFILKIRTSAISYIQSLMSGSAFSAKAMPHVTFDKNDYFLFQ